MLYLAFPENKYIPRELQNGGINVNHCLSFYEIWKSQSDKVLSFSTKITSKNNTSVH